MAYDPQGDGLLYSYVVLNSSYCTEPEQSLIIRGDFERHFLWIDFENFIVNFSPRRHITQLHVLYWYKVSGVETFVGANLRKRRPLKLSFAGINFRQWFG